MNHTLCMKLCGGNNTRFSVGGLVGSKSIGIGLPHVCFLHFVLHFVCQGLLRNRESFGKFRLSPLHPRKHVLSPPWYHCSPNLPPFFLLLLSTLPPPCLQACWAKQIMDCESLLTSNKICPFPLQTETTAPKGLRVRV